MTAPYRLVGRLKNNRLWQAILKQHPDVVSQADAARALGITEQDVGKLLNNTIRPSKKTEWPALVLKVCDKLSVLPQDVFDPVYFSRELPRVEAVWTPRGLMNQGTVVKLLTTGDSVQAQESEIIEREQKDAIQTVLNNLRPREVQALELRFGLNGYEEHTLKEAAEVMMVSKERVRAIEAKALRKLRHPSFTRVLKKTF